MDYYSYTIEDAEESCNYTFHSEVVEKLYSVDFDAYMYRDLLEHYPSLLSKGYALSFYSHSLANPPVKKKYDGMVSSTIIHIIKDYFQSQGPEVVLLYHCDHSDNRQECRHILFEKWYQKGFLPELTKEGIEVEVPLEMEKKKYYLGYLTNRTNPNLESIKQEFGAFSYNMVSYGDNKNT